MEIVIAVLLAVIVILAILWRSAHKVVMSLYELETDEDWKGLRQTIAKQRAISALHQLSRALRK